MKTYASAPVIVFFLSLALLGITACSSDDPVLPAATGNTVVTQTYTLDQVVEAPITGLVGRRINLRAPVAWENYLPGCVDTRDCPRDQYFATALTVSFVDGDDYVPAKWQNQNRGDMRIASDRVTSAFNDANVEEYYFDGYLLDRDADYVLTGVIAYRDWIGGGNPPVDNPAFIEQSNQVTYWSQTFEFRLERVRIDRAYRHP